MYKKIEISDFVWAVEIQRLSFEIMGLWPKDDKFDTSNLWSKLCGVITLSSLIFVVTIPIIHAVIQVWGNMVLVVQNLRIALPVIISLIKYVIMLWKQTGISKII